MKLPASPSRKFLLAVATAALIPFTSGTALALIAVDRIWLVVGIVFQSLGAAILFPIVVSFAYDKLREKWFGDEVWRVFSELSDAGIIRIYQDRETSHRKDNAEARLIQEFQEIKTGEVLMMGPTLRVFFNPLGPFCKAISSKLVDAKGDVTLRVLIQDQQSPCAQDRVAIEEPDLAPHETSQSQRDSDSTVARIRGITHEIGPRIYLKKFQQAPYCTAVIFPHVAYYSPNLLSKMVPVRMPMVLFRSESHGYKALKESFNSLWDSGHSFSKPDEVGNK